MTRALLMATVLVATATFTVGVRAAAARDVNSLGMSATYDVSASFSWEDGSVAFDSTATVTNPRPWTVDTLAFNLSTLRTGRAQVTEVAVDGSPVEPQIDDQDVLVTLLEPLLPGATTEVRIAGTARLNQAPDPNSDEWGFARASGVMTAYRWIPWLTRTTPFDRPSVGEPFVTASSPRVTVRIDSDPALIYASSGVQSADGAPVFEATNVRDFNFSASPDYQITVRHVEETTIAFYHRTMNQDRVLGIAEQAFRRFSERIGPYPYALLTIAEVGPWSPLESPAHFWLPSNHPARLIPWSTAHEVGHQWFYAVVGNDQPREPFADEAITDFIARDLVDRFVASQCPPGRLDRTIYELGECYPWVIYVQGNLFLRDYRDEVGGDAFWRGLADYYAQYRFGMGSTRALLAALDRAGGRTSDHVRLFPRLYLPAVFCLPPR